MVSNYLENHPESSLANLLSHKQQNEKLDLIASDILQAFLEVDVHKCEPMRILLHDTFSGVVMQSAIRSCSSPEWINGWIVYLLEEGEPELMNAIDAGVDKAQERPVEASDSRASISSNPKLKNKDGSSSEKYPRQVATPNEEAPSTQTRDHLEQEPLTSLSRGEPEIANVTTEKLIKDNPSNRLANGSFSHASELPSPGNNSNISSSLSESRPKSQEIHTDQTAPSQLTLQGAAVSIMGDDPTMDNVKMRTKPTNMYLVQIEPISRHPGWVIARKYSDFEILHEVLRRISVVSGVGGFSDKHNELPSWKNRDMQGLRSDLELYLKDALRHERLADCEGIKRFFEKSRDSMSALKNETDRYSFSFPRQSVFENMGKNVLGRLSGAPKGATGNGKGMFDGVAGVFGASSGAGRKSAEQINSDIESPGQQGSTVKTSESKTSLDWSTDGLSQNTDPADDRAPSSQPSDQARHASIYSSIESPRPSIDHGSRQSESSVGSFQNYTAVRNRSTESSISSVVSAPSEKVEESNTVDENIETISATHSPKEISETENETVSSVVDTQVDSTALPEKPVQKQEDNPLSEDETRMAVELMFAVITETYSLSSVWNIRKKLLNASKSFLLRPRNPHIDYIKSLLQESVIDFFGSDENMGYNIRKLRENTLPTEEEYKAWPPPLSDEEKENLRIKARKLLITRGMPLALTSVMGSWATEEALGRIFDCLQTDNISRGFVVAMFLQFLKAVLQ